MDTSNKQETKNNQTDEKKLDSPGQSMNTDCDQDKATERNTPSEGAGNKPHKAPSIKQAALLAIASAAILAGATYWYTTIQIPLNEATSEFNKAVTALEARNAELDKAVLDLQNVLKSGDAPLDPSVAKAASAEIGLAQRKRQEAPNRPQNIEDIRAETKKLQHMGEYTEEIANLQTAQLELETSIKQLKQVTTPKETFVIERIKDIDTITGVEAVTEDNDPNGHLGKAGGYTAAVYFSSSQVNSANLYLSGEFTPIVDAGCDGGGVVEVYASTEDARRRDEYLANFDGGILASGSHRVLGTCVVRTSILLKASQQQALEQAIADVLTRID